jgi:hypothetical protein
MGGPIDSPKIYREIAACVAPVFTDLTRAKLKKAHSKKLGVSFFTIDLYKTPETD